MKTPYDNENDNWRILTNNKIYAKVKKTYYNRDNKVKEITLVWACMEVNRIPKRVLYMNLETTRLRGRPRNRWQDEVREDDE
jgi:hypothetical protein